MLTQTKPLLRIPAAASRSCPRSIVQQSCASPAGRQWHRSLQTGPVNRSQIPDFAFAFDIDGVLLRSSNPLPHARQALTLLQRLRIPFILLTNGGGKHERDRVAELSRLLSIQISPSMFVQSHTPFADLIDQTDQHDNTKTPLKDKTVLVCGGDGDDCRQVAESYGFTSVVTPADIITSTPTLWPFTSPQSYTTHARPLPHPIYKPSSTSPTHLTISSIFVFADPRDWALDTQLIIDVLLSQQGVLGTTRSHISPIQDHSASNVPLYFSNPDLHWASQYHIPRLGQGGFKAAFMGVWKETHRGIPLEEKTIGKPSQETYAFAEKRLVKHRRALLGIPKGETVGLRKVYMVGDNPLSDIQGGNTYLSPLGSVWNTILVRTGVYNDSETLPHKPTVTVDGVWDAVKWALEREGWPTDEIERQLV
ncbi:MAG: hypothetical protein LQ339_005435 [Xanthoria mediterranea]|nr:MAG: hypothetical protein LQ339_005435 [Xanthoria mediterranea]